MKKAIQYLHWLLTSRIFKGVDWVAGPFTRRIYESTFGEKASLGKNILIVGSTIGCNVSIADNCTIKHSTLGNYVRFGRGVGIGNSKIGSYSYITGRGGVSRTAIGKFCSIGLDLICGRGDHPTNFLSTSPAFYLREVQCGISFTDIDHLSPSREIVIKNDVWIGDRVFIRDGVTIGNGAIIGAGAVVVKDVPDYAIMGGVPAKIIRFRFNPSEIELLNRIEWWDWDEKKLKLAQPLIIKNDVPALLSFGKERA